MSWRPPSGRLPGKRRRWWGLVSALVAINVGVFLYHGDPRARLLAPRPAVAAEPVVSSLGLTPGTEELALTPGGVDGFDPWLGVRARGPVQRIDVVELGSGEMPAHALERAGLRSEDVATAFEALEPWVDFRRMRPGDRFVTGVDRAGTLWSLDVEQGPLQQVRVERDPSGGWDGRKLEAKVDSIQAYVQGEVRHSLWSAIVGQGEDPRLVDTLVEVLAWDIDFYKEVHPGDTFRMLVEKRFVNGDFLDYGPILAAEFVSQGRAYRVFAHANARGIVGYFDEEGRSARKQLLKSPLKYARVTSRFGKRRHPILGYTRAHNGVDYGVPTGTPVWSVGSGRVVRAGRHGGYGNLVEVRHANGYLSQYAHLSRINVRVGQRVDQKEVVGLVGQTGLASGPHLHFGLKKNGVYVNPLSQSFRRGEPLRGEERDRFLASVEQRLHELAQIEMAREPGERGRQEG